MFAVPGDFGLREKIDWNRSDDKLPSSRLADRSHQGLDRFEPASPALVHLDGHIELRLTGLPDTSRIKTRLWHHMKHLRRL
jgi:hypothetical protein